MTSGASLTLVDGGNSGSAGAELVAHWGRSDVPEGQESVPLLVERNWRKLRRDYLAWIHDIGEAPLDGSTIKSRLRLDAGFSAWWLTLMAEKSPMKTRTIYTVLKLRALESLCEEREVRTVDYAGDDGRIAAVLRTWCGRTGRSFRHTGVSNRADPALGRRVRFLPHGARGLAWLCWTWWSRVRPVRSRGRADKNPGGESAASIVTYFPNCDMAQLTEGRFRSNYWQALHDAIDRLSPRVDWVWLYAPSDQASLVEALDHRARCDTADSNQRFYMLEQFVAPSVMVQAARRYLSLVCRSGAFMRACARRPFPGSRLDFGPVLVDDWACSLRGIAAAEGAYYSAAFEAMAEALPKPRTALYVFENQPWEAALVSAWRRAGAGRVIAHQHEAVKPLNLRLFDDARTFHSTGPDAKPLPDILAVGSARARDLLCEAGWPLHRIHLVESLRFRNPAPAANRAPERARHLLLVTGYLKPETQTMLRLTSAASACGKEAGYDGIIVKPHPFLPVDELVAAHAFDLPVTITSEPLEALWGQARYAFFANSTAAVFEALAAGVPCGVCAPEDDLNLSPALGVSSVPMIANASGLQAAMASPNPPGPAPEFCDGCGLPRWRALLSGAEEPAPQPARALPC